MSRIRSILKDSDSQCSRLVRSNFLPSGSMSLTSKISSNSTPAMVCPSYSPSLDFLDSSSSSGSPKLTLLYKDSCYRIEIFRLHFL